MYCIEIPKGINKIISLFYYVGIWHRGDKATVKETRLKLFYCFYYLLFPISTMIGAIKSDINDEAMLLAETAIATMVLSIKLFYIIWRKEQILEMLTCIGVISIKDREEFTLANDKLKTFMKFVTVLMFIVTAACFVSLVLPIFEEEKKLFFNVGFPLDYNNNEIAFWLATAFTFTEMIISIIIVSFSIIIWYLMLNCALRYEILGRQITNMGVIKTTDDERTNKRKMLEVEKQILFFRDLTMAIDSHQHIRELVHRLESFVSNIFFLQIITSGLCICCSLYCLAFNVDGTLVEYLIHLASLFYNLSDIFMIMYFGNEIKLTSDRLSYCLFESNWIDQPPKAKKFIIIFGELLMQPHELVIGKLYPLTLEMFRRILNVAYKTFNILKNLK